MTIVPFDMPLIEKYNVNGPRYTSYPTALQFTDFAREDLLSALAASPNADQPLSLYLHLPFCSTLCYYCACSKVVTRDPKKGARYLDALLREMDLVAPLFEGRDVAQMHWGGGTPTFYNDRQVETLMNAIRERFQLRDGGDGEYSIEIDPRTVDADRIWQLRKVGFNRLSLGIQDFDPIVQKAVNRKQSFEATSEIVRVARDARFDSVSVDLIYGLPGQSHESVGETLTRVLDLSPDRISVYNYAHMPDRFPPQRRIASDSLPSPDEKLQILKLCIDVFTEAGYEYIGMDHFAKADDELARAQREGTLQRNFQGYSTHADCDLVGLGVTAISHVGNSYSQNAKDLDEYQAIIDSGVMAVQRGVLIDEDDQLRARVIMDLACSYRARFDHYFADAEGGSEAGFREYFAPEMSVIEDMKKDGLVAVTEDAIEVTPRGRLLVRNVCMVFDRHLSGIDRNRFSRAV